MGNETISIPGVSLVHDCDKNSILDFG